MIKNIFGITDKETINRQIQVLHDIAKFIEDTHNDLFNECVAVNKETPLFFTNNSNVSVPHTNNGLYLARRELEHLPLKIREQIRGVLSKELLERVEAETILKPILDVTPDLTYISKLQPGKKIRYIDGIPVEADGSSEKSQTQALPKKKRNTKRKTPKKKPQKDSSEPSEEESKSGSEEKESEEKESEEKESEEAETHVFIIHGTLNPDDNRIDTDEELEKRQKYIYDLRYWAWKRLNALGTFKESVKWDHVEAFFYRHTEDSVWARMFSPPIFWSPIEHTGTVLGKIAQAGLFGKYDFGNTELTESNLSIVRRIAQLIEKRQNVLLYGFSVGGLVIQRICELLNICSYNDELSKLILGVDIDIENLEKFFKAATFGSIYISPIEKVDHVSLKNYMLVDDVATRTNFFDFGFGYLVPNFEEYDPQYIHYICNQYTTILYEYLKIEDTNVVYLHKWHTEWYNVWKKKEEIKMKVFTDYKIEQLKNLYREHNPKYDLVFNKLIKSRTNDVDDLPQTCNRPSAATVENAQSPLEPIPEAIRYVDIATTVEELISDEVRVPEDFYKNQDQFIRKKAIVLNKKLKEAEEAREALDKAELKKEDQKSQRDARARRRDALKELRTDLVDLTENGAVDLMTTTNSVEAETPEEDMLNFSNILAQLESRSVFLKGDGLKNIRFLTSQAINRGIGHRNQIQRIQGGSKRDKNKQTSETVS
jgi:hypothetical protein